MYTCVKTQITVSACLTTVRTSFYFLFCPQSDGSPLGYLTIPVLHLLRRNKVQSHPRNVHLHDKWTHTSEPTDTLSPMDGDFSCVTVGGCRPWRYQSQNWHWSYVDQWVCTIVNRNVRDVSLFTTDVKCLLYLPFLWSLTFGEVYTY